MTDSGDGIDDGDVRAMVRHLRPEWRVRDWTPADEGTDFVCFVDAEMPDGDCAVVLKAASFLDPESFRPEPRTLALVADRTDVPAPRVLGACDAHDDLPAPFFLMDRLDGEQVAGPDALAPGALDRLARDAGRNLADLHDAATWDGYGWLRCADDVDAPAGPGGLAPADPHDSWRERLRESAEPHLADLHPRFADLEADLRAALDARLDAAPRRPEPVLVHGDYRYGNLLLDPESGATRAVLDWGNQSTGDAAYDLVFAEQYLCGWAGLGDPVRERVRDALRAGYRERRAFTADPARRDCYLLDSALAPLAWFGLWHRGQDADERDAAADRYRDVVRALV